MKAQKFLKKFILFFSMLILLFLSYSPAKAAEIKKPLICIDAPVINSVVKGNIVVRGWALNASGVKEIDILIDGNIVGQATIGGYRPDVNIAYPGYSGGDVGGFNYYLDINTIAPGTHQLSVRSIGIDNTKAEANVAINIQKNKPITFIDAPKNNSSITEKFSIQGWALNASGVKVINILVDNKVVGQASTGGYRPDVNSAYPGYPGGDRSGYNYNLDIGNIIPGIHTVAVQTIGNDGSKDIVSVSINIQKPKSITVIDAPNQGDTIRNGITIRGWALNTSGVKQIDILIDGKEVGQANTGGYRPDVNSTYPGYPSGDKSGYSYQLDITSIVAGTHIIQVNALGNDNSQTTLSIPITIEKLKPIMAIDSPKYNELVKSNFNIGGWALNASGVKQIDILVDGKVVGQANTGGYRPDVNSTYPGYTSGDKSGYNYQLDITSIAPGKHIIQVNALGNDNTQSTQSIPITIDKLKPIICIDSPNYNEFIKNKTNIRGWALNASGINTVNISIDGIDVGQATIGIVRTDVNNAYPGYLEGDKSGYSYSLDTSQFQNGIHKITVVSLGKDGTNCQIDSSINIQNDSIVYSDYNSTIGNMVDIQVGVGGRTDKTGTWTDATRDDIEKYVNPENFQDDYGKYQFLKLNFTYGVSADDLNKILVGKGVLEGKGQVFLNAAKTYNLSPIYLVSHALLETGNGTSALANGVLVSQTNKLNILKDSTGNSYVVTSTTPTNVTPRVAYNVFGIHAYDYSPIELKSPVVFGSEYAYSQNWFTIDDAIMNGASWVANWITTNNQNTLYKMRWNPQDPKNHHYASDVAWAYKQISNIKALADQCPNSVLVFDMPRYLDAALIGKTIVVDPGHNYGGDDGAYSTLGGTTYIERDLNMQMALKLKVELEKLGATVVLTRQETDMSTDALKTSLQKRVDIANNANADLFISLHHDSSTSSSATGISTHYSTYKPGIDTSGVIIGNDPNGGYTGVNIDSTPSNSSIISRDLATKLADGLSSALGYTNRLAHDHNLFVTVNTNMPAVLIEEGFISNQAEAQKCADPAQQTLKAQKIAQIIKDYYLVNTL